LTSTNRWFSVSMPYVTPRARGELEHWAQEATQHGQAGTQRLHEVVVINPPDLVAGALRTPDGELVVVRRRVILLDGRPVELADSYYPVPIARGTDCPRRARSPAVH